MKVDGAHRPYNPGEDMAKHNAGIVVCQAASGRPRGQLQVCAKDVTKSGRYKFAGGWHDVYDCTAGHRFGVTTSVKTGARSVIDVPKERATFGGGLGF